MKENAYAKINLAMDVFNIREDGYHDIHSIMTPIDFYDELEISLAATRSAYARWFLFRRDSAAGRPMRLQR